MRILIVEDDELARMILESILQQEGHEVVLAEDGQQALHEFCKKPFPVVISDWQMPTMNGLTLCREIRKIQCAEKPLLVMITATTGEKSRLEAMEAGVDEFITKPVDVTSFKAWCKMVLKKNRLPA